MPKKGRGFNKIKPIIPPVNPGEPVHYHEWRNNTTQVGISQCAPIWTDDGYWEMDITVPSMDHNPLPVWLVVIWDKKNNRWQSGDI